MLPLFSEVRGLRVLDAACGPGRYAEWLADHGADVTAFDVSPRMLANARRRLGTKAHIEEADLNQPLSFLADESFDLVLCALGLDYVRDWRAVFVEFHRVLRRPGSLVFSIEHPLSEYSLREARDYYKTEYVEYTWRAFGRPVVVPSFRRPLMEVFNTVAEAGFCLDRVVEPLPPLPTEEFEQQNPTDYEKLVKRPSFLCVRALKK